MLKINVAGSSFRQICSLPVHCFDDSDDVNRG
jgi:hypothetical protein